MTKDKKYFTFHGDSLFMDFSSFKGLQSENQEFSQKIQDFLYKNELPVKGTGNTYRAINHWTASGLIDDKREDSSKWRKFNLQEALWIGIISELRKFDLSIEKIRTVKEWLLGDNITRELFEYYVFLGYLKKKEIRLLVFENGEADFVLPEEIEITEKMKPAQNYLSISFTGILETIVQRILPRNTNFSINLNETEKSLFFQMFRSSGNKEEYEITAEEGRMRKYKKEKKITKKIDNGKEVNLRGLVRESPDSEIRIYTNSKSSISNIEIRKGD